MTEAVATQAAPTNTPAPETTQNPAPAATDSVPQKVEYKFDPVEGVPAEFDADIVKAAEKLGMTAEQAKAYRDYEIELAKAADAEQAKAEEARQLEAEQKSKQEIAEWEKAAREHKEYGGAKYDETNTRINKILAEYGSDGLAEDMAKFPALINEPKLRNFLAKIAYAHSEGTFIKGNATQAAPLSDAQMFYGKK